MPLQVENGKKMWRLLPTNDWQDITLLGFAKETFKIRDDLFYVKVKDVKN
jgi:hypothetical protein